MEDRAHETMVHRDNQDPRVKPWAEADIIAAGCEARTSARCAVVGNGQWQMRWHSGVWTGGWMGKKAKGVGGWVVVYNS